jgi:CheY-like chemotaxis protein
MNENQTILFADDNEDDLMLMRFAYRKAGINPTLHEVHDGREAVAYLKGEGIYADRAKFALPSVMLLDLEMPKLNGFEVLEWVRTQPHIRRISILILTSSMRIEDVERAFDLGANSFLVKPGTLNELTAMFQCLHDWLQISHFPPLNHAVRKAACAPFWRPPLDTAAERRPAFPHISNQPRLSMPPPGKAED